nr:MAG TPA: hypothetical protein [Caudoviricetes sp.]
MSRLTCQTFLKHYTSDYLEISHLRQLLKYQIITKI